MSDWANGITEMFGYVKEAYGNVVPATSKPFLDSFIDQVKKANGPSIELIESTYQDPVLGTIETGYQLSYNGTVYTNSTDLIDAASQSEYYSDNVYYGSIGPEEGQSPAQLYSYIYDAINPSIPRSDPPTSSIPGSSINLIATISGDNRVPSLIMQVRSTNDTIAVVPTIEDLIAHGTISAEDAPNYIYINYQVLTSGSGDVLLKFYRSTSALTPHTDHHDIFDNLSINHYVTINDAYAPTPITGGFDFEPPKVHNDAETVTGGFALAQYDAANADDISFNNFYYYGVLFMNPVGAPLIYITSKTESISRSATTSMYALSGEFAPGEEPDEALYGERYLAPSKSDSFDTTTVANAPLFSPASKDLVSKWSGWLCIGKDTHYSSVGKMEFGSVYRNDHGFLLNGGVLL